MVPLSEMFGYLQLHYVLTLKDAEHSQWRFDHYEEVPKIISEEIIKKIKANN